MTLIQCEGCQAVFESRHPACPNCGRCPGCGERRVSGKELAQQATCSACGVPFCGGCGRCHACGTIRFAKMKPHSCGYPADEKMVRQVEKAFGLNKGSGG